MSASNFVTMAAGVIIREDNFRAVKGLIQENSPIMSFTEDDDFSQDTKRFLFNIEDDFRINFPSLEPIVTSEEIPYPTGMFIIVARSTFTRLNDPEFGYRPFVFPQDLDKFVPNEEELASLNKLNSDIVIPSGAEALKFSPILWSSYS